MDTTGRRKSKVESVLVALVLGSHSVRELEVVAEAVLATTGIPTVVVRVCLAPGEAFASC